MIKGFTMDNERLKGNGGGNYWKELLARIKDIRSSEYQVKTISPIEKEYLKTLKEISKEIKKEDKK